MAAHPLVVSGEAAGHARRALPHVGDHRGEGARKRGKQPHVRRRHRALYARHVRRHGHVPCARDGRYHGDDVGVARGEAGDLEEGQQGEGARSRVERDARVHLLQLPAGRVLDLLALSGHDGLAAPRARQAAVPGS